MTSAKITAGDIKGAKGREKIPALTAYDYPMARFLDEAGIPLILVGDSLGMVTLGYPDTTWVTMADMEHHVRAVARAKPRALLAADMPYHSCSSASEAVTNARRLMESGAEAVKAEGGKAILPQVRALVAAGIPFIGHLGMLPQSVHQEGGYRVKGKTEPERATLLKDAEQLAKAGAFAIVLELVTPVVAAEITKAVAIPTIGIGSGPHCDGQILVTTDLWGTSAGFIPRHVKPRPLIAAEMRLALAEWMQSVVQALPVRAD